jgi:hypothetical protein
VTEIEAAALASTEGDVWHGMTEQIDPRLRNWSLVEERWRRHSVSLTRRL